MTVYPQSPVPGVDDLANLATKIAQRLFASGAQQELCARHLARLLSELSQPLNPKVLRSVEKDAILLTMRRTAPAMAPATASTTSGVRRAAAGRDPCRHFC